MHVVVLQSQTMKMMYAKIAETLRDTGLTQAKPTDYLNFYCLGNRETKTPGEAKPLNPPDNNTPHVSESLSNLNSDSYGLNEHVLAFQVL